MKLRISEELKKTIEERLGRSADDIRVVPAMAWVEEQASDISETDKQFIAAMRAAGIEQAGPPMLSNGRPTVMRMVAWMAHEGKNKNNLFFVKDELPAAAQKIDRANALVMDFNHSAVVGWSFEPKAIGYWHTAEYRRDPKAANGEGKFGILLTGTMWSWAFPEHADKLLAEQSRHGKIDFSMAALGESYEIARDADGAYEIAHNPTFFTLSALDVPPADPDAIGLGEEGTTDENIDATLTQKLTGEVATAALKEEDMKELMEQIAALKTQIEGLSETKTQLAAAETKIAEMTTALETMTAEKLAAETKVAELVEAAKTAAATTDAATLDELKVAQEGVTAELAAAQAKVAELTAALTEASEKLAKVAETEAAAAKATRLATRMAELPKSYLAAFEKRADEKKAEMKTRWADMSDEQWESVKEMIGVGDPTFQISYLAISQAEGDLPNTAGEHESSIDKKLAKIRK